MAAPEKIGKTGREFLHLRRKDPHTTPVKEPISSPLPHFELTANPPHDPKENYRADLEALMHSESVLVAQATLDSTTRRLSAIDELLKQEEMDRIEYRTALDSANAPEETKAHYPIRLLKKKSSLEAAVTRAERELEVLYEDWVVGGDEDRLIFFTEEYLADDRAGREALFVRFVRQHGGRSFLLSQLLSDYDYFSGNETTPDPPFYQETAKKIWSSWYPEGVFYVMRWVGPGESILLRNPREIFRALEGKTRDQLRRLGFRAHMPDNIRKWISQVPTGGYANAMRIEDEGDSHYGWFKVRRGEQHELLFKIHDEITEYYVGIDVYVRRVAQSS
jgi:hypothetical protein